LSFINHIWYRQNEAAKNICIEEKVLIHLTLNPGVPLRGNGTLKYGNVDEKFNFLEIQELRPLRNCQKHFEMMLPNFHLDECEIEGKYSVV